MSSISRLSSPRLLFKSFFIFVLIFSLFTIPEYLSKFLFGFLDNVLSTRRPKKSLLLISVDSLKDSWIQLCVSFPSVILVVRSLCVFISIPKKIPRGNWMQISMRIDSINFNIWISNMRILESKVLRLAYALG